MGLGEPGLSNEIEGFRWAWLAQALSKKVGDLGGQAGRGLVDQSERFGEARLAQGRPIEVRDFGVMGPGAARPPSLANPHIALMMPLEQMVILDKQERSQIVTCRIAPLGIQACAQP